MNRLLLHCFGMVKRSILCTRRVQSANHGEGGNLPELMLSHVEPDVPSRYQTQAADLLDSPGTSIARQVFHTYMQQQPVMLLEESQCESAYGSL